MGAHRKMSIAKRLQLRLAANSERNGGGGGGGEAQSGASDGDGGAGLGLGGDSNDRVNLRVQSPDSSNRNTNIHGRAGLGATEERQQQLDGRRIAPIAEVTMPESVRSKIDGRRSPHKQGKSKEDLVSWTLDFERSAKQQSSYVMNIAGSSQGPVSNIKRPNSRFEDGDKKLGSPKSKLLEVLGGTNESFGKSNETAGLLGVDNKVHDQVTRNAKLLQKRPTRAGYIPLMRETDEARSLRSANLMRAAPKTNQRVASPDFGEGQPLSLHVNRSRRGNAIVEWSPTSGGALSSQGQQEPQPGSGQRDLAVVVPEARTVLAVDQTKFRTDEEVVTKMMMKLDSDQLRLVKRDFNSHGGELDLHEFVEVMMKYQPEKDSREAEVGTVAKLCEFFSQVDINGDGSMEWAEFTGYIVESSQDRDNFRVDNIKSYEPSVVPVVPPVTFDTRFDHVEYIEEVDHFVACDTNRMLNIFDARDCSFIKSVSGHKGVVHCASHLHGRGAASYLATCANDCTLGFWDTTDYQLCQQIPTLEVQTTLEWTGVHNNKLFSGGVDGLINVWDVDKLKCDAQLAGHDDIVMDLLCIDSMGVIASASLDSKIKLWDIPTQTLRKSLPGHSKGVFSLSYAAEYRFLVSAGFDHDALVWNPYVEHLICPLKGHNSSLVGAKAIPGTPEIITADNEGVFKVWDIRNFSCVQTFSARQGQGEEGSKIFANPLCRTTSDADHGPGPNQIGAIGSGGANKADNGVRHNPVVKANVGRRRSLASSVLTKTLDVNTSLSCFAYATKHKRILAANHEIRAFDYDQPADPLVTDDSTTVGVIYNETALTFTTAAGRSVKLWDAESGRLLRIYRDISDNEITALCFDGRKRKFITGDHEGHVMVYNLANGAHMKDLSSHESEVVALHSLVENQRIISCSWDGTIKISDESDPEEVVLLMELNHRKSVGTLLLTIPGASKYQKKLEEEIIKAKGEQMSAVTSMDGISIQRDLTAMAFSKSHNLLATAALDMTICLFRPDTGSAESLCVGHRAEVSALVFLNPHPFLVSADLEGNVLLWDVESLLLKSIPVARFSNNGEGHLIDAYSSPESQRLGKASVTWMQWIPESERLYVGNEQGVVKAWGLGALLQSLLGHCGGRNKKGKQGPLGGGSRQIGRSGLLKKSTGATPFFMTQESALQPALSEDSGTAEPSPEKVRALPGMHAKTKRNLRGEITKLKLFKHESNGKDTREKVVKIEVSWQAHQGPVRTIFFIEELGLLATSSEDKMVYFWTLDGKSLGSLHQGSSEDRHVDPNWAVPVDRKGQSDLAMVSAEELLDVICDEQTGRVKRFSGDMLKDMSSDESFSSLSTAGADKRLEVPANVSSAAGGTKDKEAVPRPPSVTSSSFERSRLQNRPSLGRRLKLNAAQQDAADRLMRAMQG